MSNDPALTRRGFFMTLGILFNGVVAMTTETQARLSALLLGAIVAGWIRT